MSRSLRIEVHPLTGRIGAEVTGVDLAIRPDADTVKTIRKALLDWKVLFFRDQHALDPEAQLAFARHFGPVTYAHPTVPGLGGHPEVLDVDAAGGNVAVQWHTDVTFVDRPPLASLLRAVVAPPYGGDTLWANTAAAYDELPPPLRTLADSLDAVHTNQFDYVGSRRHELTAKLRAYADVFTSVNYETLHPLVRVHPETGARSLLLGGFARRIDGLTPRDSDALLRVFAGHVERPENVVRWRWRVGDVAFWDNRTTQHRAIADFGKVPRRLHRVTLAGDVPRGVDGRSGRSLAGDSTAYTPVAA
jgi:alpha-ketoglutarate-dependent taurine dioxygenase